MPKCARHLILLLLACWEGHCSLTLLQWNPHWQCFDEKHDGKGCSTNASHYLSQLLQPPPYGRSAVIDIDFATVIEMPSWTPPSGWGAISGSCAKDPITLIYRSSRWQPAEARSIGCMSPQDRPFLLQAFNGPNGQHIIVLAAHFPHSPTSEQLDPLREALDALVTATGCKALVMMGDTNQVSSVSDESIFRQIRAPEQAETVHGSNHFPSCCFNNGFHNVGFDRVIANFGTITSSSLLLDPLPAWAAVGEFHKPVLALLSETDGLSEVIAII